MSMPDWSAPPPPVAPKKRHRLRSTLLTGSAAIILIVIIASVASNASGSGKKKPATQPSTTAAAASCDATCQAIRSVEATASASIPPSSSTYMTPTRSDFTVTLKILSKQCFGSAGCDIEYQPKLATDLAPGLLDPSVTYDVTYVVKGGDSGPVTDTITVTGDQYTQPDPNEVSTSSEGARLTATVTDVSPE